nr:MAG TPA: hypothetical protein [Caudoviricetes sp.]DAY33917.1 MAG TPA: hypothetical protein [Caudoviricetes sp.]
MGCKLFLSLPIFFKIFTMHYIERRPLGVLGVR